MEDRGAGPGQQPLTSSQHTPLGLVVVDPPEAPGDKAVLVLDLLGLAPRPTHGERGQTGVESSQSPRHRDPKHDSEGVCLSVGVFPSLVRPVLTTPVARESVKGYGFILLFSDPRRRVGRSELVLGSSPTLWVPEYPGGRPSPRRVTQIPTLLVRVLPVTRPFLTPLSPVRDRRVDGPVS